MKFSLLFCDGSNKYWKLRGRSQSHVTEAIAFDAEFLITSLKVLKLSRRDFNTKTTKRIKMDHCKLFIFTAAERK